MPRRYWPTIPLALFLALALFFEWSLANAPYPNSETNSNQQASNRPINNDPSIFLTVGTWVSDHHDGIEAAAAILSVIFTVALVGSNIALWRVTRTAANAAKEAADAAVKGTKTAEKALAIVERAFVFIDGFNTELATPLDGDLSRGLYWLTPFYQQEPGLWITRFAAQPRWKNSGSTPTNQLMIKTDWRTFDTDVPADFDFPYRDPAVVFFLAPQAIEPSPYLEISTAQQIVAWENNRTGVEPVILIWGRADYRDVFDAPHFIEWCYKLRLSRPIRSERMTAQFIQWGPYNRSDNPEKDS
jgi:hypothetical protein